MPRFGAGAGRRTGSKSLTGVKNGENALRRRPIRRPYRPALGVAGGLHHRVRQRVRVSHAAPEDSPRAHGRRRSSTMAGLHRHLGSRHASRTGKRYQRPGSGSAVTAHCQEQAGSSVSANGGPTWNLAPTPPTFDVGSITRPARRLRINGQSITSANAGAAAEAGRAVMPRGRRTPPSSAASAPAAEKAAPTQRAAVNPWTKTVGKA